MQDILVLVVEDETLIRLDLEGTLHEGGYSTLGVASGEDAIAELESNSDIRALVTDINLAGKKTGWDVARRAREIFDELPVVYVSSVSADDWSSKGVPKSQMIQKPFAPAQITTAISQALNEADTPSDT